MLPALPARKDWIFALAYGLAFTWAIFWLWFGIASGISEGESPLGVFLHAVAPGAACLALALSAIYSEWVGGVLLVTAGLLFGVMYPLIFPHALPSVKVFCELTLSAPPLIAGLLFLKHNRIARTITR